MEDPSSPRFPPEIECMIFEIAARSVDREPSALERINLILVSKRTRLWVEPILYETLIYAYSPAILGSGGPYSDIPPQAGPPVPPSKFHLVRHLSLSGIEQTPVTFSQSTLLACCNLTTLALWFGSRTDFVFNFILEGNLPLLKRLSIRLHRISTQLHNGPDAPRRLQTLGLTHLELIGPPVAVTMYSFIAHIPNLTHLGFFALGGTPPFAFRNILSSPIGSRLKVLLVTKCHVEKAPRRECFERYKELKIEDDRFVYLSHFLGTRMPDRLGTSDGSYLGMWEFADDIVEERMRRNRARDSGA